MAMPQTAPYTPQSSSSRAAAKAVAPRMKGQRQRIYEHLQGSPDGATCDEIEYDLDMHHSSAGTRLGELEKAGFVRRTKTYRRTRSGNDAEVYVAIERSDAVPPLPRTKSLRTLAKAVVSATERKDSLGLRAAISDLQAYLKAEG